MDLVFTSIKDAIRLKFFLSANGLKERLEDSHGQFIYKFSADRKKRKRYVKALTYYIKDAKRNEWLDHVLKETYHYENEDERSNIVEITTQMFNGMRKDLTELAGEVNEKELICPAVEDLLNYGGAVSFDSFSRFRLKSYYEQVGKYLEVAIDEYKMEQEYQMFVNMLRDYLKNRGERKSVVHLYLDGLPRFYDEQVKRISDDELKQMLDQRLLANHPVYVDSAVIAPLLSMAPRKIYLYTSKEDQPLIRTLTNIFEERISLLSPEHLDALIKA